MDYKVIRSKRKTISVEIRSGGDITVRAPLRMKDADIERFVASKSEWLKKHISAVRRRDGERLPPFTGGEIAALAEAAADDIPKRVARYAGNAAVGRITVRNQKARWGSCSSKRNLNFNCLLMLCPPEVRDYVVVHELCHLTEMNHSPRFWARVESILPDYKARREWLKKDGSAIIARLRER